jgi:endonuclease YncB( thermonuclease family)
VVDGYTVRLRSGKYVRLIGVDAPETDECGGAKSTRALTRLTQGNFRLVHPAGYTKKDRYGQLLRYVHDFSRDAGRASIWRGYAQNYDAFNHPRESAYKVAERAARKANRGLWKRAGSGLDVRRLSSPATPRALQRHEQQRESARTYGYQDQELTNHYATTRIHPVASRGPWSTGSPGAKGQGCGDT